MSQKIILTDCDGVLLDWEPCFHDWMEQRGHEVNQEMINVYGMHNRFNISKQLSKQCVKQFNESVRIGFLPPMRNSEVYLPKLVQEHGYRVVCITSLSEDPFAWKMRQQNLDIVFGIGTIDELICLDTGADKDEILAQYAAKFPDAYWLEDKPENVDAGVNVGLKSILIDHPHNRGYSGKATVLEDWQQIYSMLTICDSEAEAL